MVQAADVPHVVGAIAGLRGPGIVCSGFEERPGLVRAVVDGRVVRLKVAAKFLARGMVAKPVKRQWKPESAQPAAS